MQIPMVFCLVTVIHTVIVNHSLWASIRYLVCYHQPTNHWYHVVILVVIHDAAVFDPDHIWAVQEEDAAQSFDESVAKFYHV